MLCLASALAWKRVSRSGAIVRESIMCSFKPPHHRNRQKYARVVRAKKRLLYCILWKGRSVFRAREVRLRRSDHSFVLHPPCRGKWALLLYDVDLSDTCMLHEESDIRKSMAFLRGGGTEVDQVIMQGYPARTAKNALTPSLFRPFSDGMRMPIYHPTD